MILQGDEITINTDIVTLKGRQWGNPKGLPLLALHGWLDNAGSFDLLAPYLDLDNIYLVALDFPGHGLSDHLPEDYPYTIALCVDIVLDAVYQLGWEKFMILGHSMGTAIGTLISAKSPDKISKLIMIEGIGPLSMQTIQKGTTDLVEVFWRILRSYFRNLFYKKSNGHKIYDSFEKAYQERQKYSHLTNEGAEALAKRGTVQTEEGFYWSFDLRLVNSPRLLMSEKNVIEVLQKITTPTLLIEAKDGMMLDNPTVENRKKEFKQLEVVYLPGHHHVHLEHPKEVAEVINEFLKRI